MGNDYLDALVLAVFAHVALLTVAGIFMLSSVIMHRGVAFSGKHGGFNPVHMFKRGDKHMEADNQRHVVIAAAVAGYLQAEQERKL